MITLEDVETADDAIEYGLRELQFGPDEFREMVAVFKQSLERAGFVVVRVSEVENGHRVGMKEPPAR